MLEQQKTNARKCPSRSPLRGIREQENEDVSEITYRTSNIFLTEEENNQARAVIHNAFELPKEQKQEEHDEACQD